MIRDNGTPYCLIRVFIELIIPAAATERFVLAEDRVIFAADQFVNSTGVAVEKAVEDETEVDFLTEWHTSILYIFFLNPEVFSQISNLVECPKFHKQMKLAGNHCCHSPR